MRTRKKLVAGEVDQPNHVKVLLPTASGGYFRCWVAIEKGNKFEGEGLIDQEPKNSVCKQGKKLVRLKLGDRIRYHGGGTRVLPKLKSRVGRSNHLDELKKTFVDDLKAAFYSHLVRPA